MNIFITDLDPKKCAENLDDKRVIKMILESAQMLSTAINFYGGNGPYKTTHVNHPCSVWVRSSNANYYWLLNHFIELCNEYSYRYQKLHKCNSFYPEFSAYASLIPKGDLTPFVNCTPHKHLDTINAYRITMKEKWLKDKRVPTWKKGSKPNW